MPRHHPDVKHGRIGVLLLNLGTPEATGYWPMRRYLKEFLSDRRVIEVNPAVWWFVLNAIVLTRRPFKSGEAYRLIWNKERDELPLRTITRSQAEKLAALLAKSPSIEVDWAMRYGNPSIKSRLEALQQAGCDRILLFPLYPQYSAATTATACDKAFDALKAMRWQPTIRAVPPYYADPAYIGALASSTRAGLAALDFEPEVVIASFTACPRSISKRAIPIIATAPRPRGLACARRWAGRNSASYLPFSRASGARSGSSPTPLRPSQSLPKAASSG